MNKTEAEQRLNEIWSNSPAYVIDWIRDNSVLIRRHLIDCNKLIEDFLEAIE